MGASIGDVRQPKDDEQKTVFFNSTRYLILIITNACLTFCLANPLIFNFTVICMEDVIPEEMRHANGTEASHWMQSALKRNWLFSASAIGNLVGALPANLILERYGTRAMFFLYGAVSALSTVVFPLVVESGFYPLIFGVRILQGFGAAFTMPATGAICSSWSPLSEFSMYMALLSTHWQFAAIITMPTAGAFCVSPIGWKGAFYLLSAITAVFFVLFALFYTNSPSEHANVSALELSKIVKGREDESKDRSVPYLAICATPAIVGCWIISIGGNLAFHITQQFGPTYLNKARIIVFSTLARGLVAGSFLTMALSTNPTLSQACYTASIVFSGLNVISVIRCAQLVARQYMPFALSVNNVLSCVINMVLPSVVAAVTPNNTVDEWSRIFYGSIVIIIVTNAIFVFTARAEPAPWTRSDYKKNSTKAAV